MVADWSPRNSHVSEGLVRTVIVYLCLKVSVEGRVCDRQPQGMEMACLQREGQVGQLFVIKDSCCPGRSGRSVTASHGSVLPGSS